MTDGTKRATREMQRLDWSLSRKVTQDIKTQPQINHYRRSSLHSPVVLVSYPSPILGLVRVPRVADPPGDGTRPDRGEKGKGAE